MSSLISNNKTLTIIALLLLLLSFALAYSVPIGDIDLWWHLAAGKYMVEHKSLLKTDPFCYTSFLNGITPGREMVLNGYWLSQLIFYSLYAAFNNYGLIIIRVFLLLSILLAIYVIGRKKGASDWSIILVLILAGWVSSSFTGERPQLFSFLFAPIVLYLLEDLKKACCGQHETSSGIRPAPYKRYIRHYTLLPVIFLFWANLHPGFIMGIALIVLFIVSEAIKFIFKKSISNKSFYMMCIIIGFTIAVSFINPNSYGSFMGVARLEGSPLQQRTSEYMSPITLLLQYKQILIPYWLYLFLVLSVFGLYFKQVDKTYLIIVAFLAALSLSAFRYIPFLVYTTSPITALYLSRVVEEKVKWRGLMNILAAGMIFVVLIVTFKGFNRSLGKTLKHEINENRFPEAAASFVLKNSPSGNVFNNFSWGGYLTWRLYPRYRVFIDGRSLSMITFRDYTYILWNESEARRLLDYYKINTIIISGLSPFSGEFYELVNVLTKDEQWYLAFADGTAIVFVRGVENQRIIKSFSLPKSEIYSHIIKQAEYRLKSGAQTPYLWLILEKAYMEKGLFDEAIKAHQKALALIGKTSGR